MKHRTCLILCSIHLLVLAIGTYVAAYEIESILVSGVVCSITGIVAAISARRTGRPLLALAAAATPVMAVVMTGLEALVLQLGPSDAAEPFSIVFIVNQLISTLVILVELNILTSPSGKMTTQITLQTLMIAMGGFGVFFGVAKLLSRLHHHWRMSLALALLGLAFVGLCSLWYSVLKKPKPLDGTLPMAEEVDAPFDQL
jgi:hypothetical protein